MTYLQTSESIVRRAGDWFLRSGIQEPNGGVARYYRSDLGQNARVSTEITGYAVSALLYIGERTGEDRYTEAALNAARFLTRSGWNSSLQTFPFEHGLSGGSRQAAYFFDCGIIVRGLLAAWRASRELEFLHVAVATGRSMMKDFENDAGIHPILVLPEKTARAYEPKWSASPGCYQLKSAMAWRDLFEETGEPEFDAAFRRAYRRAVETDGTFLPGDENQERIMDRLHAYCYFLEGLLPCADENEAGGMIAAGIERTARYLDRIAPVFARADVYAQLLRLRIYAADAGIVPVDETRASCEAARAAEFQLDSNDPRVAGGFAFGRRGSTTVPFVNPVSTAFCVQALELWSDHKSGGSRPRIQLLI